MYSSGLVELYVWKQRRIEGSISSTLISDEVQDLDVDPIPVARFENGPSPTGVKVVPRRIVAFPAIAFLRP